jgi:hypothetical protein
VSPALLVAETRFQTSAATMRPRFALRDNWDDRIRALMREAGLANPAETGHLTRRIGRLTYYRADRPD